MNNVHLMPAPQQGPAITNPDSAQPGLESSLDRLEEIVRLLESGTVDLEAAFKLYSEGQSLGKLCLSRLQSLENQVREIQQAEASAPPPSP